MKIIQIVTNLNIGDAIGNDLLAIDDALREAGYDSGIMAITIHEKLTDRARALDFRGFAADDLVIFHKATGDVVGRHLASLPCKKVVLYHNITPAKYFLFYDGLFALNLWNGRRQLKQLAKIADYGWGDSSYNVQELVEAGFSRDNVAVLPILCDAGTHKKRESDPVLNQKLQAEKGTKLLFIGRIAPNKKQEDIIKAYYCYLHTEDPEAKLYLVGSWNGFEKYYAKLRGFAADLGLTDDQVVFTGLVSEAEKASYLQNTDMFLCMSEHEGFCVPLLEAMASGLPIMAYAAAAVPETLGEKGVLIQNKDYNEIAKQIGRITKDDAYRKQIIDYQYENLRRFDIDVTKKKLLELVASVSDRGKAP